MVLFRLLPALLLLLTLGGPTWAQERYQRATVELQGKFRQNTAGLQEPRAGARKLVNHQKGSQVKVLGRQGRFFLVESSQGRKTWVAANRLQVRRARKAPPTPEAAPAVKKEEKKEKKKRKSFGWNQIWWGANFAYAWGARAFPDQLRVGMEGYYPVWPRVEVGGLVQLGFRQQTTLSLGPSFRHRVRWPHLGPVRLAPEGGFRYVYADSESLFGVHAGLGLSLWRSRNVEAMLGGGAEVLFLGADSVAIPVLASARLLARF